MFEFAIGVAVGLAIQYLFPKAVAALNARVAAKVDDIYPDTK